MLPAALINALRNESAIRNIVADSAMSSKMGKFTKIFDLKNENSLFNKAKNKFNSSNIVNTAKDLFKTSKNAIVDTNNNNNEPKPETNKLKKFVAEKLNNPKDTLKEFGKFGLQNLSNGIFYKSNYDFFPKKSIDDSKKSPTSSPMVNETTKIKRIENTQNDNDQVFKTNSLLHEIIKKLDNIYYVAKDQINEVKDLENKIERSAFALINAIKNYVGSKNNQKPFFKILNSPQKSNKTLIKNFQPSKNIIDVNPEKPNYDENNSSMMNNLSNVSGSGSGSIGSTLASVAFGSILPKAASLLKSTTTILTNAGKSALSNVAKTATGTLSKVAPILKDVGKLGLRFAGPTAAVAGAGLTGWEIGSYLNEKMDDTKIGEIRDKIFDSFFALIDKLTFGGISGSAKTANMMFEQSSLGKSVEEVKKGVSEAKETAKEAAKTATNYVSGNIDNITEKTKSLFGKGKNAVSNIETFLPATLAELEKQGLTPDIKSKAMIVGQLAHETGGFSTLEEGKYSAERVWQLRGKELSKYGITKEQLQQIESTQGKDALYEYMYGDQYRSSKLGNVNPGDAQKYKGRGMIQLTGRWNYEKVSKDLGIDLVNNPELLSTDPEVNAKVTAWYLKNNKKAKEALQTGDVQKLSVAINGGLNGIEDRMAKTSQLEMALNAEGLQKPELPKSPFDVNYANMKPVPINNFAMEKEQDNTLSNNAMTMGSNIDMSNAERLQSPLTNVSTLETKTAENQQLNQQVQPIVINNTNGGNQSNSPIPAMAAADGARKAHIPMITRNFDSSIQLLTAGLFSYGVF